jgi:hypothetical protein
VLLAALVPAGAAVADPIPATAMQGTWSFDRLAGDGHTGTLTFLPNGVYVHMETGPNEGSGFPGMEVGTYTFTPLTETTGHLTTAPVKDTNGDWGPGILDTDLEIHSVNGSKCLFVDDPTVSPSHFNICTPSTTAPLGLTNGWYSGSGPGDIHVLDFLANGVYLEGIDPLSFSFETGLYSVDASGLVTLSGVVRTGPDPTLSQLGPAHLTIVDGQLRVDSRTGSFALAAVPVTAVPEVPAQLVLLLGLLPTVAAARRRRRR